MSNKLSVANLVMLVGAAFTLFFSFFDFYTFPSEDDLDTSAWSTDQFGLAFATAIPAILAVIMIIFIILELAGVKLPDQVLTFTPAQMKATWGIGALGVMLGFASANFDFGGPSSGKGVGFWFMLLGSAVMTAGAVMSLLGKGNEAVNFGGGGGSDASTEPPTNMTPPPPPPPPPAP
jgi:hypothetical protein